MVRILETPLTESKRRPSTLYEFNAPFDRAAKAITCVIVFGLLALFALISYLALKEEDSLKFIVLPLLALLYFLIVVVPLLFSPRGFALTTNGILIKRLIKSILIPYGEISRIRKISWTWRSLRLGASGGLYGFFGLFYIQGLGRVWMYVTDRNKMLLIETKRDAKYIISPSDPQGFLEKLKSLLSNDT